MAKIDETLAALGCSIASINELIVNPSTTGSTEEALENKRGKLVAQSDALMHHRRNLKKVVNKLKAETVRVNRKIRKFQRISLLPDALVHFVDVIEVANQYYDFTTAANEAYDFKHAGSSIEISRTLLVDKQLRSKFNKLGKTEISLAADEIFEELIDEKYGKYNNNSNEPIDWIHGLVFKAREKGYVMDQDPMAELEKMMKFKPEIYDQYYIFEKTAAKSTEKSRKDARMKYSLLVSTMHAKYKETRDEKQNTRTRNNKESRLKRKFRPGNAEPDSSGLMSQFATIGDLAKYMHSSLEYRCRHTKYRRVEDGKGWVILD